MRSTFYGLEIARKGLFMNQKALDVTGHNIANADTPGYTRQRLITQAVAPDAHGGLFASPIKGKVGGGVEVMELSQIRDQFLDIQYRNQNTSVGRWTTRNNALEYIEDIFGEASGDGLHAQLGEFFSQIQELVKDPTSEEIRTLLRQSADKVTEVIHQYAGQLQDLRNQQDYALKVSVNQVNSWAQKIAALNEQIFKFELSGEKANDLRDSRNLILDQLSEMVNIRVEENTSGQISVYIGNQTLVQHTTVNEITYDDSGSMIVIDPDWQSEITGGKLKGYLEIRDGAGLGAPGGNTAMGIPYYMSKLDQFAQDFARAFNDTNALGTLADGSSGGDLFQGDSSGNITALTISISDAWKNDIHAIATSGAGEMSYNENALRFLALQSSEGFEETIASIISDLAVDASYTKDMKKNGEILLGALENNRQSVSGVSLDEEMTNMVRYQQAYAAAARMITAIDEAIDIIINRMGIVGR